jgi:hypothetical protein
MVAVKYVEELEHSQCEKIIEMNDPDERGG